MLYIFVDGPKTKKDQELVDAVYLSVSKIDGFKKVNIIKSNKNMGLAFSVINGVTDIIQKYGKVIVLEDDLITSPCFLEYMNDALNVYEKDAKIWSISGYSPNPINKNGKYREDVYLSVRGCSWGWATWKNRWDSIDWDVKDFLNSQERKRIRKAFNLGGNDLYFMLEDQVNGRINSWAIRWVYNQFQQSTFTVYPIKSLVTNIGLDFSGTHSSNNQKYYSPLSHKRLIIKSDLQLNDVLVKEFKSFYDLTPKGYLGVISRRLGFYKQIRNIQKRVSKLIK